jgi:hypothetical protein
MSIEKTGTILSFNYLVLILVTIITGVQKKLFYAMSEYRHLHQIR